MNDNIILLQSNKYMVRQHCTARCTRCDNIDCYFICDYPNALIKCQDDLSCLYCHIKYIVYCISLRSIYFLHDIEGQYFWI